MIDFHSHLLPAFDDGAITVDDSIAMARTLADFGYTTVCCTPHCIKGFYDLTPKKVREATLMLQADLDNAEIALTLWPGMEYMLDKYFFEYADNLLPLGDTKLILCEAPPQANAECVIESLELIIEKGFVPLVAHPERTRFFYEEMLRREARDEKREEAKSKSFFKCLFQTRTPPFATPKPERLNDISKWPNLPSKLLYQANLGSFTGFYGERVQRRAYELLKQGTYTALASDLHDAHSAAGILQQGKFVGNPLLKKLAEFDGDVGKLDFGKETHIGKEQGELF
jgi:protein-tyrosine phosphatase